MFSQVVERNLKCPLKRQGEWEFFILNLNSNEKITASSVTKLGSLSFKTHNFAEK